MSTASIPRATYRLQFHAGFTFRDALQLVPYLHDLGISHIYASPFFLSAPGSMHGYDVCDHNQFNPEVGTAADFEKLSSALTEHGMSILMDFVPNHMGIASLLNRWWADVLENGPESAYARYFDIDWKPPKRELANQVLLPILGDQYGRVLESGDLKVVWDDGGYQLDYLGHRLPMSPVSVAPLLEAAVSAADLPSAHKTELLDDLNRFSGLRGTMTLDERFAFRKNLVDLTKDGAPLLASIRLGLGKLLTDFDGLDALFSLQHYRLSYWKVATEEINYRRFFDVNTLIALRMEEPDVFRDTHSLLLELVEKKAITGIRIDHIDGLAYPRLYLQELQKAVDLALEKDGANNWLLVEKILAVGEELPSDWPISGTTGYEFASDLTGLQVDSESEKIITSGYEALTGKTHVFGEEVYLGKKLMMQVSLAGEVNLLGNLLNRISESHRWYRDFTVNALTAAVREVIACFLVYRTYLEPGRPISETDRRLILKAIVLARRRNPALERSVFEFLRDVLLPSPENSRPVDENLRAQFVLKFQQTTSPVTAKGVEDTAFYIYNRFIARNEVGSDPGRFSVSVEEVHSHNLQRLTNYPLNLLTTSTHDTKRSEDVRARLAVLSEMQRKWIQTARRWSKLNQKHRTEIDGEMAPDANEEYLIYQTILGSWPLEKMSREQLDVYIARIHEYMSKALHEAKVNSGWADPNEAWDNAVANFISHILKPAARNLFPAQVSRLVDEIAYPGMVNSLSQTVLKLTSPGVPDLYQGTEMWDLSLVDPDNRRPVDYPYRKQKLEELADDVNVEELVTNWKDGGIKLFVIQRILHLRKAHAELFSAGSYRPHVISGTASEHVFAYAREEKNHSLVVVVPRFSKKRKSWGDTKLELDLSAYKNIFTSSQPASSELEILLEKFPVAVLYSEGSSRIAL